MVAHPARTLCVIYTTAIGRVRDRRRGPDLRPADASVVLRCYAGNVTSGNGAVQGFVSLVTKEQSGPHRYADPHLAERSARLAEEPGTG